MPHALVPVTIKPHLIPFLFMELKPLVISRNNKQTVVAKVTNETSLGIFLRLLMKKTYKKNECDESRTIFLRVRENARIPSDLKNTYSYPVGVFSYLYLPEEGQNFLNEHLEKKFNTAIMFYIHSWREKKGSQSIDEGILNFLDKYQLEEYNYTTSRIRREYYRKLESGYFDGKVVFNPVSNELEIL